MQRRPPEGAEAYAMPPEATILRCLVDLSEPIEMAMGPDTLTGFLSWLESAPPGRGIPYVS